MFAHSKWFAPYVAGFYANVMGEVWTEEELREPGRAEEVIADFLNL